MVLETTNDDSYWIYYMKKEIELSVHNNHIMFSKGKCRMWRTNICMTLNSLLCVEERILIPATSHIKTIVLSIQMTLHLKAATTYFTQKIHTQIMQQSI